MAQEQIPLPSVERNIHQTCPGVCHFLIVGALISQVAAWLFWLEAPVCLCFGLVGTTGKWPEGPGNQC